MQILEPAQETSLADYGLPCYLVKFHPAITTIEQSGVALEQVTVLDDVTIVYVMARDEGEAVRRARWAVDIQGV
jgi:hypothetical protein